MISYLITGCTNLLIETWKGGGKLCIWTPVYGEFMGIYKGGYLTVVGKLCINRTPHLTT